MIENMVGTTISVEGFLADFLTPIILKISIEPTRESLIELHCRICGNVASLVLNTWRRPAWTPHAQHDHRRLHGIDKLRVCASAPSGDYLPIMGTAQEQVLGIKRFQQNQALSEQ